MLIICYVQGAQRLHCPGSLTIQAVGMALEHWLEWTRGAVVL